MWDKRSIVATGLCALGTDNELWTFIASLRGYLSFIEFGVMFCTRCGLWFSFLIVYYLKRELGVLKCGQMFLLHKLYFKYRCFGWEDVINECMVTWYRKRSFTIMLCSIESLFFVGESYCASLVDNISY